MDVPWHKVAVKLNFHWWKGIYQLLVYVRHLRNMGRIVMFKRMEFGACS